MRAVFSWSLRALSPEAARLFRLLALGPGPDISLAGAASLAGHPPAGIRRYLVELIQQHLLAEPSPGRYTCHDLLRAYAMEQLHHDESDEQRSAALHRLLDHYLHTAHTAVLLLRQSREPITLAAPQPGTTHTSLPDVEQASAWLETEQPALLAAVHLDLATPGWRAWQLAWALDIFLDRRSAWHELAAVQQAALHTAERTGDILGQAYAHLSLGRNSVQLGQLTAARIHHQHAATGFETTGDLIGQARTAVGASFAADREGNIDEALQLTEESIRLFEKAGGRLGHAYAVNNLGWCHTRLGHLDLGLSHCEHALALHEQNGDLRGVAATLDSLGLLHFRLGSIQQGIDCYHRAIMLYRHIEDRYNEADTLASLGDCHADAGDTTAARRAWQQAVTIFDDLNHADAAELHTKLATP